MVAIALAVGASLTWGAADFGGGLLARRFPAVGVSAVSQAAGYVVLLVAIAVSGGGGRGHGFALGLAAGGGGGRAHGRGGQRAVRPREPGGAARDRVGGRLALPGTDGGARPCGARRAPQRRAAIRHRAGARGRRGGRRQPLNGCFDPGGA